MKIIGIRGNYKADARRGEEGIVKPEVYLMPDSALLFNRRPLFVPDFAEQFTWSSTVVARINRLGKNVSRKFAHRYYDALTVGLAVRAEGMTDVLAETWDGAAVLGEWIPMGNVELPARWEVYADGVLASSGSTDGLIVGIDELIEYVSRHFTLKTGDLLYCCSPEPRQRLKPETLIEAWIVNAQESSRSGSPLLHTRVK